MGGSLREMDTCMCKAESFPWNYHNIVNQLHTSKNKKFKNIHPSRIIIRIYAFLLCKFRPFLSFCPSESELLSGLHLKKINYILLAMLGLCCCTQAFSSCGVGVSHWGGFSCCRAQALGTRVSVVAALRLSTCDLLGLGAQASGVAVQGLSSCSSRLSGMGSVVVAQGFSCSEACGNLPDQRSKMGPLHWQADSYPLHHQESPKKCIFLNKFETRSGWEYHKLWKSCH